MDRWLIWIRSLKFAKKIRSTSLKMLHKHIKPNTRDFWRGALVHLAHSVFFRERTSELMVMQVPLLRMMKNFIRWHVKLQIMDASVNTIMRSLGVIAD